MRNFAKNKKGAVTVFVTLLLIPAMLISGTAVDLARIHTAQSIVQDANQLAANAVLTQYDALLHDLYGLFGVMVEDDELAAMVNKYIELSIFGDEPEDKASGTFQLFYGSGLEPAELEPARNKNLGDVDVLRRQIEDYMKFRAPVILVMEVLDALVDNKLKADTEVISEKLELESEISGLFEEYQRLYAAIEKADKCTYAVGGIGGGSFGAMSESLVTINEHFRNLYGCYKAWELADYQSDPEEFDVKTDYALLYSAMLANIEIMTVGGKRGTDWEDGKWTDSRPVTGLNAIIINVKNKSDEFKPNFDSVFVIAREIDGKHEELKRRINDFEYKITHGGCSDELKKALTQAGSDGKSIIDFYRDVLKWENIAEMADVFRNGGYNYIDNVFKPYVDNVRYRNSADLYAMSLTREQLASLASNSSFALSVEIEAKDSMASYFAAFPPGNVSYSMPPGFRKFAEYSNKHKEFYEHLKKMMSQPDFDPVKLYDGQKNESGGDGEKKQRKLISSLLDLVETAYVGLTNSPLGAKYIYDSETPAREKLGILGIVSLIKDAQGHKVMDVFDDPLGSLTQARDYLFMLTYCTSMFSNYTTTRPESIGKTIDELDDASFTKSLTGVPISPEVNYFFQSEWEYLYHGSKNAGENLNAVTRLIFLVRLVCNYISVFRVHEVTVIVNSIRAAFAWCPPLGLTLSELARAAFVAAETVIDVASLRSGHKVPLLKAPENGDWICSPRGLAELLANAGNEEAGGTSDEKGLSYSNYLAFFFVAKAILPYDASAELAEYAGNLIEWNVINYMNDVRADEEKMAEALESEGRFRMSGMTTDFSIRTVVDLRMLFLSMLFAQRGVKGVIPPRTVPIGITDYRGY